MAPKDSMEISRTDLRNLESSPEASIKDVKHLSSYNWIEAPTPVIAVPGAPSLWLAPRAPRQLPKDSGLVYINQNAARHPDSPLEPLFRALYITNPSFDVRPIDVVTDRNNIRKLLSFITANLNEKGLEAFTIDVEMVNDTAIFRREDTTTQEYIGPHEFRGYGHEFEKAYTSSQITCSTGHHRIISYRFSDMNFIVRHETDGCVSPVARTEVFSGPGAEGADILSSKLESLSLASPENTIHPTHVDSKITVKEEGFEVPLSATLEIKTRVFHKPLSIGDVSPQLWISQTPKLVRAYHCKGKFEVPQVEDVTDQITLWESENRGQLQSLGALIRKIVAFVKQCGGNAIIRYDRNADKIFLRKVERQKMLPEDLYSNWNNDTRSRGETIVRIPSEQTQSEPADSPLSKTVIIIGGTEYSIDTSRIPYLSSFVAFERRARPGTANLIHSSIPLFSVALEGIESGYRHCFRNIPPDLSQHHILCSTYDYLRVDVLRSQPLDELLKDLKAGKTEYELDYKYYTAVKGNKTKARDSAFKFLYMLLLGEFQDEQKDSIKVFNGVLFVVSHPGTFKLRTRTVIRLAYEERFVTTEKQRTALAKWVKKGAGFGEEMEEDLTTSEESEYYDSDFSLS